MVHVSLDQLQPYFGFTKLPFSAADRARRRSTAPRRIRRRAPGSQFLISQGALGLICGEVGAGKTCAARAAVAGLDRSRHTIIYLANPAVGTRGIYCQIVTALGGEPHHYKANLIPQACRAARTRAGRARQAGRAAGRRGASALALPAGGAAAADELRDGLTEPVRGDPARPADLAQAAADGIVRRAGSADRAALRAGRHERPGDRQLHPSSPRALGPQGHAVRRRRDRAVAPHQPRDPPTAQQPRQPGADRLLRASRRRPSTSTARRRPSPR